MTSAPSTFHLEALPAAALDELRVRDTDVTGNPVEHREAAGGEPLRCCLRNALAGEELILFGYQPPMPASPYREFGAVLAHARRCAGPASNDSYPPDWYGRPQVLRAYDRRGWIHGATTVHDGHNPETVIAEMFGNPDVAQIHSRNVAWGCYMFTVTRAEQATPLG